MPRSVAPLAGLLLALALAPIGRAEEHYWAYSYRNIDVTATGTGEYAIRLAHDCLRLDGVLSEILGITTAYRAPVHLYAVSGATLERVIGKAHAATYRANTYETTIAFEAHQTGDTGAYFGYIGMLLGSEGQPPGPDWYQTGVPAAFADVRIEGGKVTVGAISRSFAAAVGGHMSYVPMRRFLSMTRHDAAGEGAKSLESWNTEAWFLAREVYVEGIRRQEFTRYVELLRHGASPPDAFASSFKIAYEELDKELLAHGVPHAYVLPAPAETHADPGAAQALSAPEVAGRMALLAQRLKRPAQAVELAHEALQLDAGNQSALRALALAELGLGEYPASLAAVDRLVAVPEPSAAAYADSGVVLAQLARAVSDGAATAPVDAAALRRRARTAFEHALAADSSDRRSRDALAHLQNAQ